MSTEVTPPRKYCATVLALHKDFSLFSKEANYSLGKRGEGQGSGEELSWETECSFYGSKETVTSYIYLLLSCSWWCWSDFTTEMDSLIRLIYVNHQVTKIDKQNKSLNEWITVYNICILCNFPHSVWEVSAHVNVPRCMAEVAMTTDRKNPLNQTSLSSVLIPNLLNILKLGIISASAIIFNKAVSAFLSHLRSVVTGLLYRVLCYR